MEVSFAKEIEMLRLGAGETFHGEGILAITKAVLQACRNPEPERSWPGSASIVIGGGGFLSPFIRRRVQRRHRAQRGGV